MKTILKYLEAIFAAWLLASLLTLPVPAQAQVKGKSAAASSVTPQAFPLLAPDGTAAAPSYSFSSSPNSGIFWSTSAGRLVFLSSGVESFAGFGNMVLLPAAGTLNWTSASAASGGPDTTLLRDAADTLAQRRSTNAQTFRVYNTFTDAANYERGQAGWSGNSFFVGTQAAGTGTLRTLVLDATAIQFNIAGTSKVALNNSANLVWTTDNANDIGAAGANRPRTVYTGTSFIGPLYRSDSAKVLIQGTGTGATQLAATQTTAPTCTTNCGTGSPTVAGTDTAGIVTLGTTPASGFQVNFNGTWGAAPSCIVQSALTSMVVGKMPIAVQVSTTNFVVTTNGTAPATSDKYSYICVGVS